MRPAWAKGRAGDTCGKHGDGPHAASGGRHPSCARRGAKPFPGRPRSAPPRPRPNCPGAAHRRACAARRAACSTPNGAGASSPRCSCALLLPPAGHCGAAPPALRAVHRDTGTGRVVRGPLACRAGLLRIVPQSSNTTSPAGRGAGPHSCDAMEMCDCFNPKSTTRSRGPVMIRADASSDTSPNRLGTVLHAS
jgi:hypothetical protein